MTDEIWIWGIHPVLEALRTHRVKTVLLASNRGGSARMREIQQRVARDGIPAREVSISELERTTGGAATQGVAVRIHATRAPDLSSLLTSKSAADKPFLLCLDRVQDPHNLGALVRTANAVGANAVILPDRHCAPVSGVVVKAAAGATFYTPVLRVANLVRTLDELRRSGIWTVGLDDNAKQSIYTVDLSEPIALVVGSEGEGLRRLTLEHCDHLARIPMRGSIASLNAAVAGSVAMYEVVRQRLEVAGEDTETNHR